MSILKYILRTSIRPTAYSSVTFSDFTPKKNWKKNAGNLVWNKPEPVKLCNSIHHEDLEKFKIPPADTLRLEFQNSKILQGASKDIKRLFSLHYLSHRHFYNIYEKELLDRVRRHDYDRLSSEAQIAIYTAKVRYYEYLLGQDPYNGQHRKHYYANVLKRRQILHVLRREDYRKFEWVLEQLNLSYRPHDRRHKITRKNSLRSLATIRAKTEIENKRVALEKEFDSQKISFLEKKIEKLNWIKESEKKYNLPSTVTDENIAECMEKLKEVKINLPQKMERGYDRKVDPCSLEVYDEKTLLEKERG